MSGDRFDVALDYLEYRRLRHDLERQAGRYRRDNRWGAVALTALLDALIRDLDSGWSGVELLDSWVTSPEGFCLTYRARYIDGQLGIRGRRGQRGPYLQGAETPEQFGAYFELYLTEPTGSRSFTGPDQHGTRWFVAFGENGG